MAQAAIADKRLFTPGPLTTSPTVKAAMLRDLGSRDYEFVEMIRSIRRRLLALAGQPDDSLYTAIPMQGSGTFGIEAVIGSTLAPDGKLLVVINGAYGRRMKQIADVLRINAVALTYPEHTTPAVGAIEAALDADPTITAVAVVHCETTTGIMNPVAEIGAAVQRRGCAYIVDAMSSFGAVPLDLAGARITYLVSSSNKCIEGVPGFAFVLAHKSSLRTAEGYARSVSLNLLAQWRGLEQNGQFRFTPPVQAMLAFERALIELEEEGGVEGRAARYQANHATLIAGMRALGFREYLDPAVQGYIITAFHYPQHPAFAFETFYRLLNNKGFVIYPGKLSEVDCFRIGTIGRLYPEDLRALLDAIRTTLVEMGVEIR